MEKEFKYGDLVRVWDYGTPYKRAIFSSYAEGCPYPYRTTDWMRWQYCRNIIIIVLCLIIWYQYDVNKHTLSILDQCAEQAEEFDLLKRGFTINK